MERASGLKEQKRTARMAGLWYLLLAVGSGSTWFYSSRTYVEGGAAATARNILATGPVCLATVVGGIVGTIAFVLLALALFRLLRKTGETQARLMLAFVVVAVPIMVVNIIFQAGAYLLLGRAGFMGIFPEAQRTALAMLLVHLNVVGHNIAGCYFGLWLIPFGRLAYRSGLFPRALAILLFVSGGAYVLGSLSYLAAPGVFAVLERNLSIPEAAGEMAMVFWLLIRGVKAGEPSAALPNGS